MSNAKPMAAMMQISQAVLESPGAPEAAGEGAELIGDKRAGNRRVDSSDDSGFLVVPALVLGATSRRVGASDYRLSSTSP